MAITQTLIKQPAESRLYTVDFSPILGEGESITAATSATAAPAGLTLGSPSYTATTASVRISSGTAGQLYKVTFRVTTDASNTLEGEGLLQVKDI